MNDLIERWYPIGGCRLSGYRRWMRRLFVPVVVAIAFLSGCRSEDGGGGDSGGGGGGGAAATAKAQGCATLRKYTTSGFPTTSVSGARQLLMDLAVDFDTPAAMALTGIATYFFTDSVTALQQGAPALVEFVSTRC